MAEPHGLVSQLPIIGVTVMALLGGAAMAQSPAAPGGPGPGTATLPGYTLGQPTLATAPYTLKDLAALRKVLLLGEDDVRALRQSRAILAGQTEAVLDVWYGFVAATPELLASFSHPGTGQPDGAYLAAVRKRFGQWILDTADAKFDQPWLDYQHEIGLRHAPAKKNRTDGASAAPQVNFRYLSALTIPVTTTLKPFLAKQGATPAEVERMHAAWVKSVLLQTILWSHPYVRDGQF